MDRGARTSPAQIQANAVGFDLPDPPTLGQEFTKEVEEAVPTKASVEFLRYH